MKKGWIVFLSIVVIIILVLGWFGLIPGLSSIMGATKPKDLGVKYSQEDFNVAHQASGVNYEVIAGNIPASSSIAFNGSHPVNKSWNSAQMTSLMNNRPWKYWPIKNVQLRINPDNTVEMSGVFEEKKLEGYAAAIGVPQAVTSRLNILPNQAAFYLKGSAALTNNSVSKFDITAAQMNRISIPTGILLSLNNTFRAETAYAEDVTGELSKYSGKKQAIINFINSKLSWISGFYAKSATFSDGKLNFDGTLPNQELTAR